MLEKQGYAKDTIVSFKLVNGDEIVAKVVEETHDSFLINKPCTVMPSQQGIGLLQSLFTSDLNKSVGLQKSHVMLHSVTIDQMQNHYIHTTTGIEPVTKGGIIT
jgi:ribosomal protein L5